MGIFIYLFQGNSINKQENISFLILLSMVVSFPLLKFYLNIIKKTLKDKIKSAEEMTSRLQELAKTMTNEVQGQNKDLKVILSNVDHGFLLINK